MQSPRSTLLTLDSAPYSCSSTLHTLHFALHMTHSALHTLQFYNLRLALHSTPNTSHPAPHCTPDTALYPPQAPFRILHSTLYAPQFIPLHCYTPDSPRHIRRTTYCTLYTVHCRSAFGILGWIWLFPVVAHRMCSGCRGSAGGRARDAQRGCGGGCARRTWWRC
jgi:hypothetical protein